MTFCTNCGTKVIEDAKFCQKCGAATDCAPSIHESQRQQEYSGKIYKCPNCGETLKSFVTNCPSCEFEIRDVKAPSSVRELGLKLEAIEANRDDVQKRIGNKKVSTRERERIEQEIDSKIDHQKATLVSTFPIPNTMEDLYEFIILAESNMHIDFGSEVSAAWEAKFEQSYEKARLSFGHTQNFEKIQALNKKKKSKIEQRKKKDVYLWIGLVVMAIVFVIAGRLTQASTEPVYEAENERLKVIAAEAYEALADENYVLARAKAASLTYLESHRSYTEQWDKTRKELLALIDAAANGAEVEIPETN